MSISVSPISNSPPELPGHDRLRKVAQDLEASFLSEMLKAAKFGEPRKSFGGGAGEEHFASFFRAEVAQKRAQTGGIGLAEQLFQTLKESQEKDG